MKKITRAMAVVLSLLMLIQSFPVSSSALMSLTSTDETTSSQTDFPTAENDAVIY